MITSPHNEKLKLIRKLRARRERERSGPVRGRGRGPGRGRARRPGAEPEFVLRRGRGRRARAAGRGERRSGSGTRVIGVYRQRWAAPGGRPSRLPRTASAIPGTSGRSSAPRTRSCDGPVVLGPGLRRSLLAEGGAGEHGVDVRAAAGAGGARRAGRHASSRSTPGAEAAVWRARRRAAGRDLPRRRARGPAGGACGPSVDARARIPMRPAARSRSTSRWPPPWRCTSSRTRMAGHA